MVTHNYLTHCSLAHPLPPLYFPIMLTIKNNDISSPALQNMTHSTFRLSQPMPASLIDLLTRKT